MFFLDPIVTVIDLSLQFVQALLTSRELSETASRLERTVFSWEQKPIKNTAVRLRDKLQMLESFFGILPQALVVKGGMVYVKNE